MDPSGIAVRGLDLGPSVLGRDVKDMDRRAEKGLGDHFGVIIRRGAQVADGNVYDAILLGSGNGSKQKEGDEQQFLHIPKVSTFFLICKKCRSCGEFHHKE